MEELIELYLFKNKNCPLPSLGVLQLTEAHATALYAEGKIEAPVPSIKLTESPIAADDFISFIAVKKNMSTDEASTMLIQYCHRLNKMDAYSETKLPHAGKFYVNADGNLVFKPIEIPKIFMPAVAGIRVIHPDASHAMVVGDKETTTTEMAAYYSETEDAVKNRWWIWALAFALIAAAAMYFYFNDPKHPSGFGNSKRIQISPLTETYHIAE